MVGDDPTQSPLCTLMKSLCANFREGFLDIHRQVNFVSYIRTDSFCRAKEPLNLRRVPTTLTLGRCPVCVNTRTHVYLHGHAEIDILLHILFANFSVGGSKILIPACSYEESCEFCQARVKCLRNVSTQREISSGLVLTRYLFRSS